MVTFRSANFGGAVAAERLRNDRTADGENGS